MNEAELKGKLVKACEHHMRGAVVLRHEEIFTAGYPDMTVTWRGRTVWLEVKWVAPRFRSRGLQEDTCRRLEGQGSCYYILYEDKPKLRKLTKIVRPKDIGDYKIGSEVQAWINEGFDHDFVANFVRQIINGTWERDLGGITKDRRYDYNRS